MLAGTPLASSLSLCKLLYYNGVKARNLLMTLVVKVCTRDKGKNARGSGQSFQKAIQRGELEIFEGAVSQGPGKVRYRC